MPGLGPTLNEAEIMIVTIFRTLARNEYPWHILSACQASSLDISILMPHFWYSKLFPDFQNMLPFFQEQAQTLCDMFLKGANSINE